MNRRHLLHLLLTGISLLPCTAQETESVTLRFLSFPLAVDPKPMELMIGEGKTIPIEAPNNEFSQPYKVKSPGVWAVGETTAGDDGKQTFKTFGTAKALASPEQLVLLIRKGKDNSEGIEVTPIDSRHTNFGGGTFLFMNATRVDIAGVVGGKKFVIKPGTNTVIKPEAPAGERTFQTELYFKKGEEAKEFFSSKWPVSAISRSMVFFYHDPENDRLRMHTIQDYVN